MRGIDEVRIFEALFAIGIVTSALTLLAAARRLSRRLVEGAAAALALAATAAWIAFALSPGERLALSAAGLSTCLLAALAAFPLRRAAASAERVDAELRAAEARLHEVVERETLASAAQLERVAARARAESVSTLAEEERRLGEERRRALLDQERTSAAGHAEQLAGVQRRVEGRLAAWAGDLERAHETLKDRKSTRLNSSH